jgi:hypothetical protein
LSRDAATARNEGRKEGRKEKKEGREATAAVVSRKERVRGI